MQALRRIFGFLLLVGLLYACSDSEQANNTRNGITPLSAADIAANNRGVGLMGYFDYTGAYQVFTDLALRYPENADIQVNLAISKLNRQQPGDEQKTLDMLADVLASDPANLRAHYISGLVLLYLGKSEAAAKHFRRVIDADPNDAYATYFFAQSLAQEGDFERALRGYRRAFEIDPW